MLNDRCKSFKIKTNRELKLYQQSLELVLWEKSSPKKPSLTKRQVPPVHCRIAGGKAAAVPPREDNPIVLAHFSLCENRGPHWTRDWLTNHP